MGTCICRVGFRTEQNDCSGSLTIFLCVLGQDSAREERGTMGGRFGQEKGIKTNQTWDKY